MYAMHGDGVDPEGFPEPSPEVSTPVVEVLVTVRRNPNGSETIRTQADRDEPGMVAHYLALASEAARVDDVAITPDGVLISRDRDHGE